MTWEFLSSSHNPQMLSQTRFDQLAITHLLFQVLL